jgi:hypothetical protein
VLTLDLEKSESLILKDYCWNLGINNINAPVKNRYGLFYPIASDVDERETMVSGGRSYGHLMERYRFDYILSVQMPVPL